MDEKHRSRPSRGRPPIQRRPPETRGASADELMEMADALEEQARDILRQAKHLQRIAERIDQAERRPPARPARPARSERSDDGGAEGGARPPQRRSPSIPPWVPRGKKKRPEK